MPQQKVLRVENIQYNLGNRMKCDQGKSLAKILLQNMEAFLQMQENIKIYFLRDLQELYTLQCRSACIMNSLSRLWVKILPNQGSYTQQLPAFFYLCRWGLLIVSISCIRKAYRYRTFVANRKYSRFSLIQHLFRKIVVQLTLSTRLPYYYCLHPVLKTISIWQKVDQFSKN